MTVRDVPNVGAAIRRLREERGWSQETLAQHAGLTLNSVSRLESGRHASPSLNSLYAYARAFGVPVGDLLGKEG